MVSEQGPNDPYWSAEHQTYAICFCGARRTDPSTGAWYWLPMKALKSRHAPKLQAALWQLIILDMFGNIGGVFRGIVERCVAAPDDVSLGWCCPSCLDLLQKAWKRRRRIAFAVMLFGAAVISVAYLWGRWHEVGMTDRVGAHLDDAKTLCVELGLGVYLGYWIWRLGCALTDPPLMCTFWDSMQIRLCPPSADRS